MFQVFKSALPVMLLSALFLSQPVQAEDSAIPSIQVFKNFGEVFSFFKDKRKLPHITGKQYSGYSLLPFGSRKKAWVDAQTNAEKDGVSFAVITTDGEQAFDTPPPGSSWFGNFSVIRLDAITPVDLSSDNLIAEIKINGIAYYSEVAKNPEFKGLTKDYREIIRANNYERAQQSLSGLVQLIALHDGKGSGDDLLKWAKYHKNAGVRLAAYLGLIEFGRTAEVEEVLKSESDYEVKVKVQKSLI